MRILKRNDSMETLFYQPLNRGSKRRRDVLCGVSLSRPQIDSKQVRLEEEDLWRLACLFSELLSVFFFVSSLLS